MFLSQIWLNPRDRRVQGDLANCQELHRTVLRAFPEVAGAARAELGVLYRLELRAGGGGLALLVQSRVLPDWSRLPPGYLAAPAECKPIDGVLAQIEPGLRLRFRLRANPTKRIASGNAEQAERWRGKRVDLLREEDQLAWLARKGEHGGFRLAEVRSRPDVAGVQAAPEAKLHGRREGRPLTFGAVRFDGELVVTEAEAFRRALVEGIGSGKAYGFGLLSVARA